MSYFLELETIIKTYCTPQDIEDIKKAYEFAEQAHKEQKRKSGEPYIKHPLSVATILAEMNLDKETIIAALLHDVPEDTVYSLTDIEKIFGSNISLLVNGVTKLGKVRLRTPAERQAENIRKMMLAVATDIRVLLIKLADRLHNMKTIAAVKPEKQKGIALETLEIYAPLAHRLGMYHIKWQLEDYSFRVLNYRLYKEIEEAVQEKRAEREAYLNKIIQKIKTHLENEKISADISGRPKNLYALYRNVFVEKKDESIKDVLDMYGLRIVVDTIPACYRTLGIVHSLWKPLTNRLKDYIAVPKSNGYQSLHTGVVCDEGKIVEIQIRTTDMHYAAEYGLAAHWRYKGKKEFDNQTEERMVWIRQLLEWQKELQDAKDFMDSLKLDLFQDEIFVFTPKGEVRNLPLGSTPIDFAYAVHTDLGNRCIGAKVNNKMVPLDYQLKSGDIVEILITKVSRGPSLSWLEFVKTSRTKNRIRRWFRENASETNIQSGRALLENELQKVTGKGIQAIKKPQVKKLFAQYKAKKWENIFEALGYGRMTVREVVSQIIEQEDNLLLEKHKLSTKKIKKTTQSRYVVKVEGIKNLLIRHASCCKSEEPTASIAGFITRGRGVTIHLKTCPVFQALAKEEPKRIVEAHWEGHTISYYPVTLKLIVSDRMGLMRDVVTEISSMEINIISVHSKKIRENKMTLNFVVEIKDTKELNQVIHNLEKIPDVLTIEKV